MMLCFLFWITIDTVSDTPHTVRVSDATVSLPIVVNIDGGFIKNRIAVKPLLCVI